MGWLCFLRGEGDLPFECFCEAVLIALDLEDLDGLVGGAGGQSATVVVEDGIVLLGGERVSQCFGMRSRGVVCAVWTYNHVIVTRV